MDGLTYHPDFVTENEAERLLIKVDAAPWITTFKRRVQHYGYRYDYKRRTVDESLFLGNLPTWLLPLASRLCNAGLIAEIPDQVIVNEYDPGQGIAPHVDCEPCFGDTILSLTLGSGCIVDFAHTQNKAKHSVWLAPRSLMVMHGSARYDWTHGIAPRKSDIWMGQKISRGRRVSLTFRKVILTP